MLRRTPRVTLVMKTAVTTAEFWEVAMEGVEQATADFQVDLTVTGTQAEKEIDGQIAIMDQVIEDKPDVIILAASDYNAMAESAEKAVAAGEKLDRQVVIPCVTWTDVKTASGLDQNGTNDDTVLLDEMLTTSHLKLTFTGSGEINVTEIYLDDLAKEEGFCGPVWSSICLLQRV